jgi:uncharacterized protein (DUF302 family)
MRSMFAKLMSTAVVAVAVAVAAGAPATSQAQMPMQMTDAMESGVVTAKSAYPMAETIARLKKDVADKGIMFFNEIDQAKLASGANIQLRPSVLLVFGNPPLGTQFLTSNPLSGLDWPVRLLVFQDKDGQVWTAYTDFTWIAHRHGIADRDEQFKMASMVIASITSSVAAK